MYCTCVPHLGTPWKHRGSCMVTSDLYHLEIDHLAPLLHHNLSNSSRSQIALLLVTTCIDYIHFEGHRPEANTREDENPNPTQVAGKA